MKNLLPLALVFFVTPLFSQNWMPAVPGDLYHFRALDSNFITHTIRIDSVKSIGGDSIFYLNRVVDVQNLELNFIVVTNGKAQFLGRTMIKKPDGRLDFVSNDDDTPFTVTIFPNASLGETWQAVSDSSISATITLIEESTVLGEPDSLKTIQFSNGRLWILSKNHGIVYTEALFSNDLVNLAGIETRFLGDRPPYFEEFYDFNPGDLYEWRFNWSSIGGYNFMDEKWFILDKQVLQDTFRYYIERRRKSNYDSGNGAETSYSLDTLWITLPETRFFGSYAYNKENIPISQLDYWESSSYATLFEQGKKTGNKDSPSGTQLQCAIFPDDPDFMQAYIAGEWGECCDLGLFACEGRRYYEEYRLHLGRVEYVWSLGDVRKYEWLLGAVIQGDTVWGEISPDWFFTPTYTPQGVKPLRIVPNPANDFIQFLELPEEIVLVRISNSNGVLLSEREISSGRLDVSNLPNGLYFVHLIYKNQAWTGRFQKVK